MEYNTVVNTHEKELQYLYFRLHFKSNVHPKDKKNKTENKNKSKNDVYPMIQSKYNLK